jgi:hypothetical protein
MRPPAQASRGSTVPLTHAARPQPADRRRPGRTWCGHTRYTKGCDICALTGIYQDHMSRPGITPAQRAQVIRLYLASDKAGLFKLWQAWRQDSAQVL